MYAGWLPFLLPGLAELLSLLWAIPSLPRVAAQLSADRRFMHAHRLGIFSLVVTHFQQRINLVSLFSGKLLVRSHKYSFDLAVLELILPQLTFFNRLCCTYELNPRNEKYRCLNQRG
jgi:hypothetical protein